MKLQVTTKMLRCHRLGEHLRIGEHLRETKGTKVLTSRRKSAWAPSVGGNT